MNPTPNQSSDIIYLDDIKPGDHVVCMGPNSSMHHAQANESLYQTGRVYPVLRARNPEREGGLTAGCGLFNWRRASGAEVAAHLGGRIADGHNPNQLTVQQVGEGWRLLTRDEIEARAASPLTRDSDDIQCLVMRDRWSGKMGGNSLNLLYRTKLSPIELAALIAPRPKVKVPLCADDLPSLCWVRWTETPDTHCLVTAVTPRAIAIAPHHSNWLDWAYMMKAMEYSSDRRTWRGCWKGADRS